MLVMAGTAFSIVDPAPDLVGLYFDSSADVYCIEGIAPYTIHELYLVYTNPVPEAIWRFKAGIEVEGLFLLLNSTSPCNPIHTDNYIGFDCGWDFPEPTTQAMVLATVQLLYMETGMDPLNFYLGSLEDPMDGYPAIQDMDGIWLEADLLFEYGPAATINGECVVSTESSSFDFLKAMYR